MPIFVADIITVLKLRIGMAIALTGVVGLVTAPGPSVPAWKVALLAGAVLLASASAGAFNHVVERKLDNVTLALQHLEAAARDFADRFDLPALEKLAALTHELMGDEDFLRSTIKRLLDESKEKMRPIDSIFECPQFLSLGTATRSLMKRKIITRTLASGEDLVREGEPSQNVPDRFLEWVYHANHRDWNARWTARGLPQFNGGSISWPYSLL